MSLLERAEKAVGWAAIRLLGVLLLTALTLWLAGAADNWVRNEIEK